MAKGGSRPGAGRKKGGIASHTLQAVAFRRALIDATLKEKAPIIKALIEKAKSGDVPALREIIDRVLGKVTDEFNFKGDVNHKISMNDKQFKQLVEYLSRRLTG